MSVDRILRDGALDWQAVRRQYNRRVQISQRLNRLLNEKRSADFASVALGISDPDGSYSAREHGLGPRILVENPNAAERIMNLARELRELRSDQDLNELPGCHGALH
jgi:hypothetical protein